MVREIDILKIMIKKNTENLNIRMISKELEMDYKNTYTIIKKLEKQGVISLQRFGNTLNCTLVKKNHPLIFRAEYERRDETFKKRYLRVLYDHLNQIPSLFIALLFGSHASLKASKGSDIDLMIISDAETQRQAEKATSLLPLDIHLCAMTTKEFITSLKTTEFNVVKEAVKNNIILIGIEDYYRVIENA